MALFIKKYCPRDFKEISFSTKTNNILSKLIERNNIPNMLICGPPGSGKKCRIMIMLSMLYGNSVFYSKMKYYTLKYNKKIQYMVKSSDYHMEITSEDNGNYDYHIITELVSNISDTLNIYSNSYKILIIHKAHLLSDKAQFALRRLLEQKIKTLRFIFISNTITNLCDPLMSRLMYVQLSAPSVNQTLEILNKIIKKENIKISVPKLNKIINNCNNNLKKTIHIMQLTSMNPMLIIPKDKCNLIINSLLNILFNNNNDAYSKMREKIYELMEINTDMTYVLKTLTRKITAKYSNNMVIIQKILEMAADVNYMMVRGQKNSIHIETFLANCYNYLRSV